MKSTLPFFAFVSINITPYINRVTNDNNTVEYLPENNRAQRESIVDNEERLIESVKYNKDQRR